MANPNRRLPSVPPLVPRVGFDILADSVCAVQCSLRTEAVPLAATASSDIGHKVRSSFVEGLGKRMKTAVSGTREDEGAAQRRVMAASDSGAVSDVHAACRVSDNATAPDDCRSMKRPLRGSNAAALDDHRSTKRPSRGSGALVTPSVFARGTALGTTPSGPALGTTPSRPNNHSTYLDVYEDHMMFTRIILYRPTPSCGRLF